MRHCILALLVLSALGRPAGAETAAVESFDWKPWRSLAVQDHGRQKPLDSLAWETWRLIANRTSFTDPETGQKLDPTALYLSMLLDWRPGEKPLNPHSTAGKTANPHSMAGSAGVCTAMAPMATHAPDRWDRCDLILVDSLALREALGMAPEQKYISPLDLSQAKLRDPHTQRSTSFLMWTALLDRRQERKRTPFEQKAVELAGRLRAYREHRSGQGLEVLPIPQSEDRQWASLNSLLLASLDDKTDPGGVVRQVREKFQKVQAAYLANSPAAFNEASAAFLAAVRETGPQLGPYPSQKIIDLEVAYNHWVPFRFAWVIVLVACLCLLVHMGSGWKFLYPVSLLVYLAGMVAMVVGFAMRISISGRAPVTNMYESVIYVALGVAFIGLLLELIYRKRFILAAASIVATLALILADNCPALLDPSLQPLQPVLRNNFWLVTHVLSITLSYAAFALALVLGDITLGYYLSRSKNFDAIEALSNFTYRTLQVGVVLLAVGTVLGAVWADYSWGRFWGWDPKEVSALVTLIVYLAVLHGRYSGWMGPPGLAACAVVCFSLVILAWFGVNLLGTGLHSYGFASGGSAMYYVGGIIAAQFVFVSVALLGAGAAGPAGQVVE